MPDASIVIPSHQETPTEELASGLTHAAGAVLASVGLVLLTIYAALHHDARRVAAVSVYGVSLVVLYSASTAYHFTNHPGLKQAMKVLDHAAIYLLIAGTYTPILVIAIRGSWGLSLFIAVWAMAALGIVLKLFYVNRFKKISTAVYVMMGWLVLIVARQLFAGIPHGGIVWLFAGGFSYTGGVLFYLWDRLPFNHAIWHLFVIAGSVCHFLAVMFYVLPIP